MQTCKVWIHSSVKGEYDWYIKKSTGCSFLSDAARVFDSQMHCMQCLPPTCGSPKPCFAHQICCFRPCPNATLHFTK